jgi:hypothetical protein
MVIFKMKFRSPLMQVTAMLKVKVALQLFKSRLLIRKNKIVAVSSLNAKTCVLGIPVVTLFVFKALSWGRVILAETENKFRSFLNLNSGSWFD